MRISDGSSDVCSSDLKDDERDDFLQGLEFGGAIDAVADAVCRHREAIFEEGQAPCQQYREPDRARKVAEMSVPGKGHEDVGDEEEADGQEIGGHMSTGPLIFTSSRPLRSEEHTTELQSLMSNSYHDYCLKKKNTK